MSRIAYDGRVLAPHPDPPPQRGEGEDDGYGLICLPDLMRLAEHTGDNYYLERPRNNLVPISHAWSVGLVLHACQAGLSIGD